MHDAYAAVDVATPTFTTAVELFNKKLTDLALNSVRFRSVI